MTAITVGLVNNMPDAALEATQAQFAALLAAAAEDSITVTLRCTSLPEVPRGPAAAYIGAHYEPLAGLLADPPDALIVTGAEPLAARLQEEPYWQRFTQLADWSLTHTASALWSCLAAHAVAQHLSGIRRQRLPRKCHGVFDHTLAPHPLTAGLVAPMRTPHSRWNDVDPAGLRAAGYDILSVNPATGANIFARGHGRHLLVCVQGHPEYERDTLLREYRRDIARFLKGQQPLYPDAPVGYFPDSARQLLEDFRERAIARRREEVMSHFPLDALQQGLPHSWRADAEAFYRNWIRQVVRARE